MNSLDFLHYVIAASIILVAVTILGIGFLIGLLLYEARRALKAVQQTSKDIGELKSTIQSDIIGSVVTFGKKFFQKKIHAKSTST